MKNVATNLVLQKSAVWLFVLFPLVLFCLLPIRPAAAQTDPETTPVNGYPPPATPARVEEGYPNQPLPTPSVTAEGYVAPTAPAAAATNLPATIGESQPNPEAAVSANQTTPVRNRAILWAGFLLTLLIFTIAVYGAMLMYTRPRT